MEPTNSQLKSLYDHGHLLTNVMFQPIHIICLDERIGNLFILAGHEETLEFEINPQVRLVDDEQV